MEDYIRNVMDLTQMPLHLQKIVCDEMVHGMEVSNLAVMIAQELGEPKGFCEDIALAGIVHDIGKLRLTKYLYAKDGLLIEHMKYVRQHSAYSFGILQAVGYKPEIALAIYHHHENFDGSGYPDNLKGETIPWMARILRVCDVFTALTATRSYRNAFDSKSALEIMIDEVADYDMKVFLAFQRVIHREVLSQGEQGIEMLKKGRSRQQIEPLQLFIEESKGLL